MCGIEGRLMPRVTAKDVDRVLAYVETTRSEESDRHLQSARREFAKFQQRLDALDAWFDELADETESLKELK